MSSRRRRGREIPPAPDPDDIALVEPEIVSATYCSRDTDTTHRDFIYDVRRFARNNRSEFVILSGKQNLVIKIIDDDRNLFMFMDRESLYIWGLFCGGKHVVFKGYTGLANSIELPYGSGYIDLDRHFVGKGVFESAITSLIDQVMAPSMTRNANHSLFYAMRHTFLTVIIHISEAVRFQLCTFYVHMSAIPKNAPSTPVTGWLVEVFTNWSGLSNAVDQYRPPDKEEDDPPELNSDERKLLLGRVEPGVPYSANMTEVKKNGNVLRNLVSVSINYLKVTMDQETAV